MLFFGYGAYRSRAKISQITGKTPEGGAGAILEGYQLAFQSLSQIPQPVQDNLRDIWGDEFKAYTLKKGNGIVSGIIWNINEEDFKIIKEWEYVGAWREIIEVEVKTSDGLTFKTFSERVFDSAPIAGIVDGLLYDEFSFVRQSQKKQNEDIEYYTQEQLQLVREQLKKASSHA